MPAITADTLTLPRFPVHLDAKLRRVQSVTAAPGGFEGEGFPVRRAFAGIASADLDPFVHMDQMGEVEYAPGEPKGTPWPRTVVLKPSPTSLRDSSFTRTPWVAAE